MKEAGYEVRDRKLVDSKTGAPFTLELLGADPAFERVMLFFKPSLERLGITVSVRTDRSDAVSKTGLRSWDFDMMIVVWPQSLSPGNEQREYWGSQAADTAGSRNIVGIKNPAIDELIERIIFAKDRAELVAATQGAGPRAALESLSSCRSGITPRSALRAGIASAGRAELPKYGQSGFPALWWYRCRQGGQERQAVLKDIARMAQFSRRHVLGLGVGALAAARLASRRSPTMAAPRCTAFRRSAN